MDWQQPASLAIVAVAGASFFMRKWRRAKKLPFQRGTHCGCGSVKASDAPPRIIFRQRKGERAQVIVGNSGSLRTRSS